MIFQEMPMYFDAFLSAARFGRAALRDGRSTAALPGNAGALGEWLMADGEMKNGNLPSGKHAKKKWKITRFNGKTTISMVIFNSKLLVYPSIDGGFTCKW